MNLKNMLRRITDNYHKDKDSNVYKLFSLISPEVEDLKETFEKIESWQGTDNAEGTTLDLIGEDVREKRKGHTDEEYRPLLKFRISLNRSNADINGVNNAINSITNGKLIRIKEIYKDEPASILVILSDYEINTPYEKINDILAAGVRVYMRVEKTTKDKLYLGSVITTGEDTTIRPYMITSMIFDPKIRLGIGSFFVEETRLFPKEIFGNFKQTFDTGLHLDDGYILDSGYAPIAFDKGFKLDNNYFMDFLY